MKDEERVPLISTHAVKNIMNNDEKVLTWSNISVTCRQNRTCREILQNIPAKSERILLNDISGIARPGEILAIMGSSGVGKTTFLKVLSGQDDPETTVSTGDILLNGFPISRPQRVSGFNIGHVEQQELFIETMSTEEHLIFQVCVYIYIGEPKVLVLHKKFSLIIY